MSWSQTAAWSFFPCACRCLATKYNEPFPASVFHTAVLIALMTRQATVKHSSQAEYVSVCARLSDKHRRTVYDIFLQVCMHFLRLLTEGPNIVSKRKFQLRGNNSGCAGPFHLLHRRAPVQLRRNIGQCIPQ